MKSNFNSVYKFPIGDWSGDGHHQVEYFHVGCNRTLEELREIDKKCCKQLGFNIGSLCGDYQEEEIDADITSVLKRIGVFKSLGFEFSEEEEVEGGFQPNNYEGPRTLLEIWLKIYQYIDPDFLYEILSDKTSVYYAPNGTPGYGLFYE